MGSELPSGFCWWEQEGQCRRELSLGPSGQPRSPCGERVDGPLAEARMDHSGYK